MMLTYLISLVIVPEPVIIGSSIWCYKYLMFSEVFDVCKVVLIAPNYLPA